MIQTKLVKPLFDKVPPDAAPSGKPVFVAKAGQSRSETRRVRRRAMPDSSALSTWELPDFKVFKTSRGSPVSVQKSMWSDVFRNMRPGDCFEVESQYVPTLANAMRKYLDSYRIPGRVLARSRIQNTMGAVWFLSNETED